MNFTVEINKMIYITLSFFATLQPLFGLSKSVQIEYPIKIFEIFAMFYTNEKMHPSGILLDGNTHLKDEYMILLDGRNIEGYNGLDTILDKDCELSFFPKLAGG